MRYRALTYNKKKKKYFYTYGLPAYGFRSEEIAEMGGYDGSFCAINPATLGKETEYKDITGRKMFTGDITELVVDGETRRFVVTETTMERECRVLHGIGTVRVRLQGVIAFVWEHEGKEFCLLPCVDENGVCDTEKMRIVGDIHTERLRRANESERNEQ